MKINVYFENSRGKEHLLETVEDKAIEISLDEIENLKNSFKVITNFLNEHNFKSYYYNMHITPTGRLWVDVGSHTEFFYIEKAE